MDGEEVLFLVLPFLVKKVYLRVRKLIWRMR